MEVCNKFVASLIRLFKSNFFNIKTLCHFEVLLKYFTCPPPPFFPNFFGMAPLESRVFRMPPSNSHQPPSLVRNERFLRCFDTVFWRRYLHCSIGFKGVFLKSDQRKISPLNPSHCFFNAKTLNAQNFTFIDFKFFVYRRHGNIHFIREYFLPNVHFQTS